MKKITNFENYIIFENGKIANSRTGRVLKPNKNQKGYFMITLSKNGLPSTKIVHRLVYQHYKGEIPENLEINHIDGDKENNHISNLETVTRKENMIKAVENGQVKSGADCKHSISVNQINPITKQLINTFGSIAIATKKTGVHGSLISMAVNGKRKSAGGFLWDKI